MNWKNVLIQFIPFILTVNSCFAQFITNKDHKFGLLDSSGSIILETRYDTVYQVRILYYKSKIYAFRSGEHYGLYNSQDKKLTSLEFDEIKQDRDGAILFRKDSLWGFVSETESFKYKIGQASYKEIFLDGPGHNPFGSTDREQAIRESFISVFNGEKWGLLNYSDSDTIVSFKSDHPIHSTMDCDHYSQNKTKGEVACTFYCPDRKSTIVLPTYFADIKHKVFYSDNFKLFQTYYFTSLESNISIFNYFDGKKIFDYTTKVIGLEYRMLSDDLIYIKEEETVGKTEFYKLMVFNIFTGKIVTEYKTRNYDGSLDIIKFYEDGSDREYICFKPHMNAKPKKLKEL